MIQNLRTNETTNKKKVKKMQDTLIELCVGPDIMSEQLKKRVEERAEEQEKRLHLEHVETVVLPELVKNMNKAKSVDEWQYYTDGILDIYGEKYRKKRVAEIELLSDEEFFSGLLAGNYDDFCRSTGVQRDSARNMGRDRLLIHREHLECYTCEDYLKRCLMGLKIGEKTIYEMTLQEIAASGIRLDDIPCNF